ncbi:MAG TPA: hypothetical protein RMH80_03930, partial [Polyangiaceae bacterium LLY-WYZ-15_(1-7)]|nr:hypothetical protein [Polyangiaceae bacterium LLY-WYZ-15_(1-7)]
MLGSLFQSFLGAPQGQQAMSRLQAHGYPPGQARGFLESAFPVAARAVGQQQAGGQSGQPMGLGDVGSSHYVTNFLSGAVSGLVRGQGLMGAAVDGLQGAVGGHVAQVIASRWGLPQRIAGTVGAIITPLAIDFLWERVQGGLDLGGVFGGGAAASSAGAASGGAPTMGGFGTPAGAPGMGSPPMSAPPGMGSPPGMGAPAMSAPPGMGSPP